jgi:cobalamin biosynthesis protein CobD/CbiB
VFFYNIFVALIFQPRIQWFTVVLFVVCLSQAEAAQREAEQLARQLKEQQLAEERERIRLEIADKMATQLQLPLSVETVRF